MRDILFRAMRADNRKWIYGYYAVIGDEHTIIKAHSEDYYSVGDSIKKSHGNEVVPINPETIGQYTGYKDDIGKRIFEGDIVCFEDMISTESGYSEMSCCGEVGYDKKEACFYVNDRLSAESWEVLGECHIVGNIFDNPNW